MSSIPAWIWVFAGGGLGSLVRWQLSNYNSTESNSFPWGTWSANLVACLVLGLLLGYHLKHPQQDQYKWLAMVGFCGGFSTFSTFSLELFQMLKLGHNNLALAYLASSMILGVVLIWLGIKVFA